MHLIQYENEFLNHPTLLNKAYKLIGNEAINPLIKLGSDKDIAEQILLTIDNLGIKEILKIFFEDKIKTVASEVTLVNNESILEIIKKIEAIVGKEALVEIRGFYQYVSTALSNNQLSTSAMQVIQIIASLTNNLEEWLDFGSLYESVDIDNQVTIILTQLEHWFDFVASGQMHIGLPPRYPGFDPDYDSNDGSGGEGQGLIYGSDGDNEQREHTAIFFTGLNTTSTFEL